MVVTKVVVEEKDKFGTDRFAVLKAEFTKRKLSKEFQRRLERIVTVYSYRRDVAHELHHLQQAKDYAWTDRHKVSEVTRRLEVFKPVQFFLDAMQTLLDEVRKEEALKPPPRVRQYNTRSSWG